NLGQLYMLLQSYEPALSYLEQGLKIAKQLEAKELIRENYEFFSDLYSAMKSYKKALKYYKLSSKVKSQILTAKSRQTIADLQTKYETEKKEKRIELLKKDNDIKQLELKRQEILRHSLQGWIFFAFVLAFFMYYLYFLKKKAHLTLKDAHNLIKLEKEKSDKLLLNVLPIKVANDLKEKGKTKPESFDNVTTYFSDIVGFTNLSSQMEPKILIDELNNIFTAFDNIIEKHQCERIKTIGDAYLCVCGMPEKNPHHAENVIKSAIEIIKYLRQRNQNSEVQWEIRIGIHTGSVVGGIVGIKKYIYDVFGDTINTTSRMEANSESMKINISETTYQLVKDKFKIVERGMKLVKGKGNMKMYFIDI
ncbi:adenylate/guanylate cyclase domain-containing protein, partial [Candidatus Parabeggiatoa sp. HSG14]|uniref:adenylate/guanylate cyclase domain-containing protein n=1 Tax=Candidatus Parabeggiatoa sp. HSG14 TaxID=3055593 RepID=UPI0025A897CB|nr:adenylate/guanylate cyclase domain-containing protein [Thiotrichales bacterium HSG14]